MKAPQVMTAEEFRALTFRPRRGRYNVAPEVERTVDGYTFASKRQAAAAAEFRAYALNLWPDASIAYDVRWPLLPHATHPARMLYLSVDFVAWKPLDCGLKVLEAVDVKPRPRRDKSGRIAWGGRSREWARGSELFYRCYGVRVEVWER